MVAWDKVKEKIFALCSDSTAHGINNICRTKRDSFKLVWLFFLTISAIICMLLIVRNILDYLKYPVTTKINHPTVNEAEFPSVAVCNSNPFLTKFSVQKLIDHLNVYEKNSSGLLLLNEMLISNHTIRNQMLNNAYNMNETFQKLASFPLNEVLISCMFKEETCTDSDFEWFWSYSYGNCFVINSINRNFSHLKVHSSGKSSALELELFSGFESLVPVFEVSQGFVVMVFDKKQDLRFNTNFEFTLAGIGAETNIAMNRVKVKKLPKPYSNCDFDIKTSSIDTFESPYYKVMF